MRAGNLRHRLVVQAKTSGSPTRSGTGAMATGWATLLTVWGSLDTLSGRRLEAAQATWPEATGESVIRYRSEIAAKDLARTPLRITHKSRTYVVGKVIDRDGTRGELRLLWKEGAALG